MSAGSTAAGMPRRGLVAGYRCATCGTEVGIDTVHPWRCPGAPAGDHHHVLHPVVVGPDPELLDDPNPFVRYGRSLAWWAFARAQGMSDEACVELTRQIAAGFHVTPFGRHATLAERLGVAADQVWVKDETGQVGGSHKARHLVGILLHLRAAELLGLTSAERPPLAIASCGNAAIAASTLAQRVGWPIDVFVPDSVSDAVAGVLESLGARLHRCARQPGQVGDPAVHEFRAAVERGAIPFSVQGPENGLCLDGGRTLGWELREGLDAADAAASGAAASANEAHGDAPASGRHTRVVVQVGGGALAACVGWGLGPEVRVDLVQTEGGAPLARAWERAGDLADAELGQHWDELMTAWDNPHSLADGILDDETYDWQADVQVMRASGGRPVVAPEEAVVAAYRLASELGAGVSPTGSAGLAALLAPTPGAGVAGDERAVVLFTGVAR
ncbi:MAG TPA: PLP-dependent lyase/thiolase [Dermatophilaceae bacterium]|nr:PLP-dependent lyase/thiolase [Dermatophilaceae bacterium]